MTHSNKNDSILDAIIRYGDLSRPGAGIAFVIPVEKVVGAAHLLREIRK